MSQSSLLLDTNTNGGDSPPTLGPGSVPAGFQLSNGQVVALTDSNQLSQTVDVSVTPTAPPAIVTGTSTSTQIVATVTAPASTTSATPAPTPEASSGPSLSILLPAIIVPIVVLIPLIIWGFFCIRNRKLAKQQKRMSTPDMDMQNSSTGAALLHKQSQPSLSMTPFNDGEKHLNHYDTQSSFDNDFGGEAITLNARNRSWSDEREPSQLLPSPGLSGRPNRPERPKDRPKTQDAWPLPAHETLPEPSGRPSTSKSNKPLPTGIGAATGSPRLPPIQFNESMTLHDSIATNSSLYDLSSATKAFPDVPVGGATAVTTSMHRKRDSDQVSDLSDSEEVIRPSARRDTDAISVVSAMTNRSRSQRRKSSASAVSALAPEDEQPEIPMQHYPRR